MSPARLLEWRRWLRRSARSLFSVAARAAAASCAALRLGTRVGALAMERRISRRPQPRGPRHARVFPPRGMRRRSAFRLVRFSSWRRCGPLGDAQHAAGEKLQRAARARAHSDTIAMLSDSLRQNTIARGKQARPPIFAGGSGRAVRALPAQAEPSAASRGASCRGVIPGAAVPCANGVRNGARRARRRWLRRRRPTARPWACIRPAV